MTAWTQFYDSWNANLIPAEATHAALYGDGDYESLSKEAAHRFKFKRWITVVGGSESCDMGLTDYEPGNWVYGVRGALRAWAVARHEKWKNWPIVYCDRADAAQANAELNGLGVRWWIATLDNDPSWTPEKLSANMASGDNGTVAPAHIPANVIWANQWTDHGNDYDQSNLFGDWWA